MTGKVETLYGRARFLPELQSRNYAVRENARRMAINARIQGTAADLLKLAMVAVHRTLADAHPEARLLLTVHDELVLEVPESAGGAGGSRGQARDGRRRPAQRAAGGGDRLGQELVRGEIIASRRLAARAA